MNLISNPFSKHPSDVQQALVRRENLPTTRLVRLRRHMLTVPIGTFLVLFAATALLLLFINRHDEPVKNAYVVIVNHDHATQTVPSREPTVGLLLKKLDIKLNEGDVVEPAMDSAINQDDFRINVFRAVPVQVVDNGKVSFTFSAATTSRSIATQAGITTYAEDKLNTQPITNFVSQGAIGEQVVISRSIPINFNLYGTLTATRTHAKTVGELVAEKGVKLAKNDQISPASETLLTPGLPVFVSRNGTKLENVTEPIAMPKQIVQDATLAIGTGAVRQAGSPGEQITTYETQLVNNLPVGRKVVQTVITKPAVTQIEVQGTSLTGIKGNMALAGISPSDYTYVDYIVSHESGWCPTKAQGQYGACPAYSGSVPSGGGYGLCQSTPPSKMASAGADWATSPITQLRWCAGYAQSRYGSWAAAYNHWLSSHNW